MLEWEYIDVAPHCFLTLIGVEIGIPNRDFCVLQACNEAYISFEAVDSFLEGYSNLLYIPEVV